MTNLRRTGINLALATAAVWLFSGSSASADEHRFRAKLAGRHETPVISTGASGEFHATLNAAGDTLTFELTFSDLEGGNPAAAHVHLGQPDVAGGVMFFLCGGGGKPSCPASPSGTVTGTVIAADVIGPAGQGIAAGQFDEVIRAMRKGLAYANVHTTSFPTGEIRGQLD